MADSNSKIGSRILRRAPSRPTSLAIVAAAIFCLTLVWVVFEYPSQLGLPPFDGIDKSPSHEGAPDPPYHNNMTSPNDGSSPSSMPLRIVTYNIRYATDKTLPHEKPWDVRRPKLINQLRFITEGHENSFLCLQEALYPQIEDLEQGLGNRWSRLGRGRGNKENDGEFSPIFYRSDVWEMKRYETRWLSRTPHKPSKDWDAVLNRIVTMGEFAHRTTGTRVIVMSTHFDHIGAIAREKSAELLLKFAREWSKESDAVISTVLIGGDFNSKSNDGSYQKMIAPGSGMSDIAHLVPDERKYGNMDTYSSFDEPENEASRIDFLFIREPRTALIHTYGVLENRFDDGIYLSDHRPVVADMEIMP